MNSINKKEITSIFEKMKKQKEEGFNELYNKYNSLVKKISFSILKDEEESKDLSQIVFTKIYELPKEKLPSSNESSWLYSVTKNETLTYMKKKKDYLDIENIYTISSEDKEINEIIEKDNFNRLINKLPPKEQEIVSLKILSQMSFKDIGNILNIPTPTVQWHYYKATNTLKILIGNLSLFIITMCMYIRNKTLKTRTQNAIQSSDIVDKYENSLGQTNGALNNITEENTTTGQVQMQELHNIQNTFLLCGSTIFLVLTIIFIIISKKYQQISHKNKSK